MDLLKNLQEGDDEKRSLQARPGSVNEISGACESHTYSCAQKHLCARLCFFFALFSCGERQNLTPRRQVNHVDVIYVYTMHNTYYPVHIRY